MQSLPEGSEVLLLVCAIAGVSTWYLTNFTDREGLARLFALIGISSMLTMIIPVILDTMRKIEIGIRRRKPHR